MEEITINELLRRLVQYKYHSKAHFIKANDLNQSTTSLNLNGDKDGKSNITWKKLREFMKALDEDVIIKTSIGTFKIN